MNWLAKSRAGRSLAGLGALVIAGTLAAACSTSSSSGTTTTAAPGTTTAPNTSTTATTAASTTTTSPAADPGAALLGKFQSGEAATFAASYKITSSTHSGSTLTIAQQSRHQLFRIVSGSSTTEFISLGTKGYFCTEGTSAATTCLSAGKSSPYAALVALYQPSRYLPYFQAAARAAGAQASYSSKSVNGFSLSCVSVTGATGETGTGTFCVTAEGVLGYVSWTGTTAASSGSFEITSYSTSVPSSEFTLPATPTTIP